MTDSDPWTEEEYTRHLESERRAFAWVLRTYGSMTSELAWAEAEGFYVYEPPGTPTGAWSSTTRRGTGRCSGSKEGATGWTTRSSPHLRRSTGTSAEPRQVPGRVERNGDGTHPSPLV